MSIRNDLLEQILAATTGGSSAIPLVVSGSPFVDLSALDAWSQANQSELLNNETNYASAVITGSSTYRWDGVEGVYSSNGWIVDSSALTPSQLSILNSIESLSDGQLSYKLGGELIYAGATKSAVDGSITFDQEIRVPEGTIAIGPDLSLSSGTGTLVLVNSLNDEVQFTISNFYDPTEGASAPYWTNYEAGVAFPEQPVFDTNITTNPLTFTSSTVTTKDEFITSAITLKASAPMTNLRGVITDVATGNILKYVPSKVAFDTGTGGMDFVAGDNRVSLVSKDPNTAGFINIGNTPFVTVNGQVISFTFEADAMNILGDSSENPYQFIEGNEGNIVTLDSNGSLITSEDRYTSINTDNSSLSLFVKGFSDYIGYTPFGTDRLNQAAVNVGPTISNLNLAALPSQTFEPNSVLQSISAYVSGTVANVTGYQITISTGGSGDIVLQKDLINYNQGLLTFNLPDGGLTLDPSGLVNVEFRTLNGASVTNSAVWFRSNLLFTDIYASFNSGYNEETKEVGSISDIENTGVFNRPVKDITASVSQTVIVDSNITNIFLVGSADINITLDSSLSMEGDVVWISGTTQVSGNSTVIFNDNQGGEGVDIGVPRYSKHLMTFDGSGFSVSEFAPTNADDTYYGPVAPSFEITTSRTISGFNQGLWNYFEVTNSNLTITLGLPFFGQTQLFIYNKAGISNTTVVWDNPNGAGNLTQILTGTTVSISFMYDGEWNITALNSSDDSVPVPSSLVGSQGSITMNPSNNEMIVAGTQDIRFNGRTFNIVPTSNINLEAGGRILLRASSTDQELLTAWQTDQTNGATVNWYVGNREPVLTATQGRIYLKSTGATTGIYIPVDGQWVELGAGGDEVPSKIQSPNTITHVTAHNEGVVEVSDDATVFVGGKIQLSGTNLLGNATTFSQNLFADGQRGLFRWRSGTLRWRLFGGESESEAINDNVNLSGTPVDATWPDIQTTLNTDNRTTLSWLDFYPSETLGDFYVWVQLDRAGSIIDYKLNFNGGDADILRRVSVLNLNGSGFLMTDTVNVSVRNYDGSLIKVRPANVVTSGYLSIGWNIYEGITDTQRLNTSGGVEYLGLKADIKTSGGVISEGESTFSGNVNITKTINASHADIDQLNVEEEVIFADGDTTYKQYLNSNGDLTFHIHKGNTSVIALNGGKNATVVEMGGEQFYTDPLVVSGTKVQSMMFNTAAFINADHSVTTATNVVLTVVHARGITILGSYSLPIPDVTINTEYSIDLTSLNIILENGDGIDYTVTGTWTTTRGRVEHGVIDVLAGLSNAGLPWVDSGILIATVDNDIITLDDQGNTNFITTTSLASSTNNHIVANSTKKTIYSSTISEDNLGVYAEVASIGIDEVNEIIENVRILKPNDLNNDVTQQLRNVALIGALQRTVLHPNSEAGDTNDGFVNGYAYEGEDKYSGNPLVDMHFSGQLTTVGVTNEFIITVPNQGTGFFLGQIGVGGFIQGGIFDFSLTNATDRQSTFVPFNTPLDDGELCHTPKVMADGTLRMVFDSNVPNGTVIDYVIKATFGKIYQGTPN